MVKAAEGWDAHVSFSTEQPPLRLGGFVLLNVKSAAEFGPRLEAAVDEFWKEIEGVKLTTDGL